MKTLFIAFVTFCFFSIPSIAHACSCSTGNPAFEFNSAKAVFIGRMLGGTEKLSVKDGKGKTYQLEAGEVRFTVEELFKGSISSEVTVHIASMKGTSCGDYGLKRGELHLVYAYESEKGENVLYSGVCTRTITINSEYVKEDLEFLRNLPPAGTGGNIQGRIWADAKKISGGGAEPLPNIKIKIRGEDGQVTEVTTDKDGEFELKKIRPGKYRVEPQLPEDYHIEEKFRDVDVADRGAASIGIEVNFTGKVVGRVIDKNGIEYNSIFLEFLSTNEDENQRSIYGHAGRENGEFSVEGVPPSEYVLFLELRRKDFKHDQKYYYPGTFKREDATVIKVGPGGKVEGLNFILPDEFQVRTIEGQVFWKDGKPASEVEVMLLCPQSTSPNGFVVEFGLIGTQTDKDGHFKLEGFTGESYWIEVRGSKDDKQFHSPSRKIVLSNNLKNIKLVLSEDGRTGDCGK